MVNLRDIGRRAKVLLAIQLVAATSGIVLILLGVSKYVLLLSLISVFAFSILIISLLARRARYVRKVAEQLDNDQLPDLTKEDETKETTKHILSLHQKLEETVDFVKNLGEENYEFKHIDPSSTVGSTLASLSEKQHDYIEEERKRNWKNEGLAKFSELLRIDNHNLDQMSDRMLANLVKYTDVNQGGFFIAHEDADGSRYMELTACYAYNRKKFTESRIEEGQGLLGQVMLEKSIIYLTDIPDDYVNITSGLGESTPQNVVIIPLMVNDKFYGAIELASFNALETYEIDFLSELAENIASAVASVKNNENTRLLLEKSQEMSQELQSREEEMKQNMEELQATQEEMTRNQAELKGLFRAIDSSQGLAEFDSNRNLLTANDTLLEGLGYTLQQLQEHQENLLPKRDSEHWLQLKEGQNIRLEFEVRTSSNQKIWLSTDYSIVLDNKGDFQKILMLCTDVTERKSKQAEFERLSLVANNTDNSVIITNAMGITEYVNRGFTRLTGYTPEDMIGKRPGSVLQGEDTDKETIERIGEKLRKKEALYEEILNYDKSGNSYWISLAINPVFDADNNLDKFVSIQANITETKAKALDFRHKLDAISRSNAIIEFDMQGNILDANENFLNIFGYTSEEVIGKHHKIFVTEEEASSNNYKEFWEKLGEREFVSDEFKRIGKNGKEIWLKGIYNPIYDIRGEAIKVVKFATDITLERELQRESLIQTEIKSHLETIDKTVASLEFDMQGQISYVNQVYLDMSGYSSEELVGKNYEFLLHEDELDKPQTKMIWLSLNAGNYFNGEFKQKSKVGESMWLTGTLNPILDTTGKPVKVMMFALFNTRDKERILDLTQTVNALKNAMPTIELSKDGIFKTANDKFLTEFGYKRLDLRQKTLDFFLDKEIMTKNEINLLSDKLGASDPFEEILPFVTKHGDKKTIKAIFNPVFNEDNILIKTIVVLIDGKTVLAHSTKQ